MTHKERWSEVRARERSGSQRQDQRAADGEMLGLFRWFGWVGLAVGCWLLVVGCWLLAVGCWLLGGFGWVWVEFGWFGRFCAGRELPFLAPGPNQAERFRGFPSEWHMRSDWVT